jgi:hypothetical protein
MKRIILISSLLVAFASFIFAEGDAGNVTSLSVFKGNDGKVYYMVGHTNGAVPVGTVQSSWWLTQTFLVVPDDQVQAAAQWSVLQKALTDNTLKLYLISGENNPAIIGSNSRMAINWKITK